MCFCTVPVCGQDLFVTIKLSRWRGPDKWAGFVMLHLNCPDGDAKTMTTRASARSPIDFVPGNETVKVPQNFISGFKLNRIDFGADYETVRAAEGN
jgi:hypothetical protein